MSKDDDDISRPHRHGRFIRLASRPPYMLELAATNAALEAIKRQYDTVASTFSAIRRLAPGQAVGSRSDIDRAVPADGPLVGITKRNVYDPAQQLIDASESGAFRACNPSTGIPLVQDPQDLDEHHLTAGPAKLVTRDCLRGASHKEITVDLADVVAKALARQLATETAKADAGTTPPAASAPSTAAKLPAETNAGPSPMASPASGAASTPIATPIAPPTRLDQSLRGRLDAIVTIVPWSNTHLLRGRYCLNQLSSPKGTPVPIDPQLAQSPCRSTPMSPETIQLAFERAELAKYRRDVARGIVTSSLGNHIIAKARECEMKAREAMDPSVKRYFAKLARDYRHLAKQREL
jgi:hypothetical protein